MYCKSCGAFIPDGQTACPYCGGQSSQIQNQPIKQPVQPMYQQPAYQQNTSFSKIPQVRNNGFAVAGLILGIVAMGLCWIPILNIIIVLPGIVFSILGILKKNANGKGKAIAGIALSAVALILAVSINQYLYNVGKDIDPSAQTNSTTTLVTDVAIVETTQSTTTVTTTVETTVETTEAKYKEINPDIPIGTTYELGQGNYEVGVDIPAGRYRIERIDGNTIGGYMKGATGSYVDSSAYIDAEGSYTCILEDGVTFELSLITARFTKVTSLPNNDYLQEDGSYVLGSGYFFEGVDIPCGKYDMTAIGGNSLGIHISTYNDSFIALEQDETYSNLNLNHEGKTFKVSLGTVRLDPK